MCKFLLTGCKQIYVGNKFLCKAFKKAKNYQNLTTKSGSKQRFSLLQEKVFIQAVCLMTQAVSIKARFFNSFRPILFELCKKTTGGGKIAPPPAGIGLNISIIYRLTQ